MKEITYQESIELMGFADGHDDILVMMPQPAAELTIPDLRKLANAGAKFFVPDQVPDEKGVPLEATEEVNIITPPREKSGIQGKDSKEEAGCRKNESPAKCRMDLQGDCR